VSRQALDTLELKGTGEDRESVGLYSPRKAFLAQSLFLPICRQIENKQESFAV
jgi:hypothetical protein